MSLLRPFVVSILTGALLGLAGCEGAPGKPGPNPEAARPDHVLDFATLYGQNCVACHGDSKQAGAAISLTNPVYLAVAGEDNIRNVIANGVPGKLMPAFSHRAGGMLTDEQVDILAKGVIANWGKPGLLDGKNPPPYKTVLHADLNAGQGSFGVYCARCHGSDGQGSPSRKAEAGLVVGSIVDPAYLGLISDQALRSFTIAGVPGMPDWRGEAHGTSPVHPMTDQEVTDIVAWLASHRRPSASPVVAAESAPTDARPAPSSGTKLQEPHL